MNRYFGEFFVSKIVVKLKKIFSISIFIFYKEIAFLIFDVII